MGFDGVASQAIMFIAVLSASAMLVVAFNSQVSTTTDAMSTQQDALAYQIKTGLNIETAVYNASATQLKFYARNTGTTTLLTNKLSVYVGSQWINLTQRNITVVPDTATNANYTTWDPGEIIGGNITISLETGTVYTLRVVSQYQTEDSFDFTP